jgi:AcrR family transcriptional regulator
VERQRVERQRERQRVERFAMRAADGPSLVELAAHRSAADLVAARTEEAQRLLDAGLTVMGRNGTERRATVSEIVAEAGLSNQAFYRYFASKDDLVAAIVDDGARRLESYIRHRIEKHRDPIDQVRTWIDAVLAQSLDPKVAAPTRAVLFNGSSTGAVPGGSSARPESRVGALLVEPLRAAGSHDPEGHAYLITQVVFGVQSDTLFADPPPKRSELAFVTDFCLAAIR